MKKLDYFRLLSNGILVLEDEIIGSCFNSLYNCSVGLKVFELGTDCCILLFDIDRRQLYINDGFVIVKLVLSPFKIDN